MNLKDGLYKPEDLAENQDDRRFFPLSFGEREKPHTSEAMDTLYVPVLPIQIHQCPFYCDN